MINRIRIQVRHALIVLIGLAAVMISLAFDAPAYGHDEGKTWAGSFTVTLPAQGGIPHGDRVLDRYASDDRWDTKLVTNGQGDPQALRLYLPSPLKDGPRSWKAGEEINSILPIRPQSYIYRFKYIEFEQDVLSKVPFQYVEVDWNTEGLPRGPNGSFITPHFDFHFYLKNIDFVKRETTCESSGKTCDTMRTDVERMRRFFDLPAYCFLPSYYFLDETSPISEMGLHTLDGEFAYTTSNVNDNAVILYGTFDEELLFLEVSLTLYAFQNAVKAAERGEHLTWPIKQPSAYQYEWWPRTVALRYLADDDVFEFSYEDFSRNVVSKSCG